MDEDRRNEDQDLADAYVLGLLDDAAQAAFEARLARDPALAERVGALAAHFSALDDAAPPEPVPDTLWPKIEARLESGVGVPANANPPPASPKPFRRRAAMAAAILLALGAGFWSGLLLRPVPQAPMVIAVLAGEAGAPGAIVEAFGDDRIRLIPLAELAAPEGSVLEIWTLPDAERGPVSLGTFARARDLVLEGPGLPAPRPDQLYEITLEPEGGSPTGLPTGPILLVGHAREPVRL